jgi:hypothetical protein
MRRHWWQTRAGIAISALVGIALAVATILAFNLSSKTAHGSREGINIAFAGYLTAAASAASLANTLVGLLSTVRRSFRPPAAPGTSDIENAKDILAGLVLEQWSEEAIVRSLSDPEPIPVPWRSTEREELMDPPRLIARGTVAFPSLTGHITNMVEDFRALKYRRLVILGMAGAGKTTLAVQLLMELLRTRHADEPVPVLLSAARWDTKVHHQLRDWLTQCLATDYPALSAEGLLPDTPRTLAHRGHVLPVIDGLDELPADARADILAVLNRSMGADDQLILTCRTDQFAEAVDTVGDVLTAAAVIEPYPLSPEVAADYLQACLPPRPKPAWPRVLDALKEGTAPALAEVGSTPLGLWLVRITYIVSRQDPTPLLTLGRGDPSVLRDHLCDQLIPALVSSRPPADHQPFRPHHSWEPDEVRRWLTWLACQLTVTGENSRGVAWWHLSQYIPRGPFRVAVGLGFGLVMGVGIGLLTVSAHVGVVVGLIVGIATLLTAGRWFTQSPAHFDFRVQKKVPLLLLTIVMALIVGGLGGYLGWIGSKHFFKGALEIGLYSGLAFLAYLGVPRLLEHPTTTTSAGSPRSTWRADRNLALIRILLGVVLGILLMILGLDAKLSVPAALAGGLLIGLLFGLGLGRHHAWLAYGLSVLLLRSKGALPLRAMGFLEDAHRLGLLRTEGPFYQFRNIELQKHLLGEQRFGKPRS